MNLNYRQMLQINEQNIDSIDTNVGSEEPSISGLKKRLANALQNYQSVHFVKRQLEGPIIVNIKPSNSSTDPSLNPVFKCPISGCDECLTIDSIAKHSLEIHNQFVVICDENKCKKVFTSSAKYDEHMTRIHSKDTHFIPDKNKLINEELEGNGCYKCDICGKVFPTFNGMYRHKKFVHILKPSIECDYPGCGKKFKTQSILIAHKGTVHSLVYLKFECKQCYKGFTSSDKYEEHMARHQQKDKQWLQFQQSLKICSQIPKRFICDRNDCNNVFTSEEELLLHKQEIHFVSKD